MPEEKERSSDEELQKLLKKSADVEDFPDVPLDEFTPPTDEEWKAACEALLKGAPFEKKMFTKTYEGFTFDPMYTRKHTEDILPKGVMPGMGDYLRGVDAAGYIGKPWGIAQACDETLPAENNELLRHENDKGATIYHIVLDTASRAGVDARQAEKVGDTGTSVTTVEDMHVLLTGLDLAKFPLYVYTGANAVPLLALVAAARRAAGEDMKNVRGIVGADPIGTLVTDGKLPASLDSYYDSLAAAARWATVNAPHLRTVFVRSDVYSSGGANDVQEVAAVLAAATAYLRALCERGLTIDAAASQIAFAFSMGANFFLQIAKLRAVRPLWAQIVKAFGGNAEAQKMRIHARPALFFKTVYDPYVNMLRNTTEIFSGVVGGIDSFESAPFDEPIRKGDEFSRRIARNVQIMLQEEFGLLQPIDPAGGSWAVETLTHQMKEKIWAAFQGIEKEGGIAAALRAGTVQEGIAKVLADRFKNADLRRDRIVGNNMYPNMTETLLETRAEDTAALKAQRTKDIEAYLSDIDTKHRDETLAAFKADGSVQNAVEAALAGATIAELMAALTAGKGAETVAAIAPHRWSERFEALRRRTEDYKAAKDDNVKIFLANMGPIPQHKARADFTTGFLQVGAFEVLGNDGFKTVDEAAEAARASGADAVVICSTDATYPEIVPALAPKLHKVLPQARVFLAGAAPKDLLETYKEAGIDEYISVRANCYEILEGLQKQKGMIA
ncbi:methylmalonyl-CoA mutase family protein [Selenomonas sp. oral taxon 149]|uniref:methylmalonyl-CoA mutase family protein n=1 Tax=Selenomonas sp. oral taxon 149 TaxID=712535 RepID=UPI0001E087C5|nr:methylmalonyl-CoA mutase family protein [Selenomonas sp. oral taxon 149]EFM22324.1 putative methylmalonyl-CoA mutase, small subunit [Selenomonas sp. oral taxon 149 str. 67H29BP]